MNPVETQISLSEGDQQTLLQFARESVVCAASNQPLPVFDLNKYGHVLQTQAATFVTLTKHGALRGCIGCLEAHQPLILDVVEHAAAAATSDYRFSRVAPDEIAELEIEISVLTPPCAVEYTNINDLRKHVTPGVDGVILSHGHRRATFLPQVWEKLPSLEEFMGHLCQKMGEHREFWQTGKAQVFTYRVFSFCEE